MKILTIFLQALVVIAIPLVLILTGLRIFFTPPFAILEYNMPGFPDDPYGFTKSERIHWANLTLKYLDNNEGIDYLGDLQFSDGTPVFNERELGHMVDVKIFFKAAMSGWLGLLIFLTAVGLAARGTHLSKNYWQAVSTGGWLTLGIIGLILVTVFLNFQALFTVFHQMFFEGDTWLFYFSDTLIRLFPMRLWQDLFIAIGLFTIAGGIFFAVKGRRWAERLQG